MPEDVPESRLLEGRRVVVSRAREQAFGLSQALCRRGADVIEAPAIRIEPPHDWAPLDAAIRELASYDWIIFTSVNGVRFFFERCQSLGRSPGELAGSKLGAIGPATAAALQTRGLHVDIVPERFVAEEFFEALRQVGQLQGSRVLLPRADVAREALPELLRREGACVDVVIVYRTVTAREEIGLAVDLVTRGLVDVVTFTSGSTVRSFFSVIDDKERLRDKFIPASIGPITSQALREQGFTPGIEASEYTTDGLVEAIVDYFAGKSPGVDRSRGCNSGNA
jgi:uroporphyrinogen III methyltransferase/synthase